MMKVIYKLKNNLKLGQTVNGFVKVGKRETGSTLVEFAFASIILLGITFGMVDFGLILYTRNAVQLAAQEGAREGIAVEEDGSLRYTDIEERVKDKLILLDPAKADITVNLVGGDTVQVEVDYPMEFVTPVGDVIKMLSSASNEWAHGWDINAVATMVIH